MPAPSFVKAPINFIYKHFAQNTGSFLLWSGIVGWTASCVNQVIAIVSNDKLTSKQKKFMIPQEITDGIVNTMLFAICTRSFTKFGEKFVTSGKWATKNLSEFYKTTKVNGKTIDAMVGDTKDLNVGKELEKLDPNQESDISKEYSKLKKGVSFTFSTIGSVIACDAVTPFVRNKIASYRQKKSLEKEKIASKNDTTEVKTIKPVIPNNQPLNNPYQAKTPVTTAYRTSGSMRV